MDRDEITAAIRETDARLERIRPPVVEAGDRPLPTGEWSIRDALSHLAARSNPVARSLWRMEGALAPGGQAALDIHEENAGQVRDRADQSVDALLDEIAEGHRTALTDLAALDDQTIARRFPVAFPPGELSLVEFIERAGPRHDNSHLDEVEAALG
jgi:hypothetical protein